MSRRAHPAGLTDAMRYVLRGGIAWRSLLYEFPPWQTVYHYLQLDGGVIGTMSRDAA